MYIICYIFNVRLENQQQYVLNQFEITFRDTEFTIQSKPLKLIVSEALALTFKYYD